MLAFEEEACIELSIVDVTRGSMTVEVASDLALSTGLGVLNDSDESGTCTLLKGCALAIGQVLNARACDVKQSYPGNPIDEDADSGIPMSISSPIERRTSFNLPSKAVKSDLNLTIRCRILVPLRVMSLSNESSKEATTLIKLQ